MMGYLKKLKLSFLSVVFLIFIPLIILISTNIALLNYKDLYDHILNQINNKLLSISSVTAAFIDGDDYKLVLEPKKILSFTYDNQTNTLYGVDNSNKLSTIDQKLGAARSIEGIDLKDSYLVDIAIDSKANVLYGISKTNKLLSIDLEDKKIELIKSFDFSLDGLAYDSSSGRFYISGKKKLYSFDKNRLDLLKEFDTNLYSLNISDGKLYGIDRIKDYIVEVKLSDFSIDYLQIDNYPTQSTKKYAFTIGDGKIFMGDKHLVVFNLNDKQIEHEDFARMYRDESTKTYKKYIEPMTKIKLELDLTYHYTFNLLYNDENNNCYYIFDVHEGNEYSPIGSFDFMDEDDLSGAEDVMYRDKAYVGSTKLWDKWGLLKVAYAGIKDSSGKVVGIAGTDVDISFIKSKTHEALVYSIAIGIITLILSIFASYYIAIKIIKPIERLKSSALKIAAGNYKEKVHITSPIELAELSNSFNYMSEQLTNEIKNFKSYSIEIKEKKINEKLHKKLFYINVFRDAKVHVSGLETTLRSHGIVSYDGKYYTWSAKDRFHTKIEASKSSAVMSDILNRLLNEGENISIFKEMFSLEAFKMIDINSNKIYDILSDSIIEYENTTGNEINIGDIKIHISPLYT